MDQRSLWRRIIDFPLVAMLIGVAVIICGLTAALLLARYVVPAIPGFSREMMVEIIAIPILVVLYKLIIRHLGEHPRDDLNTKNALRPSLLGLAAGLILFSLVTAVAVVAAGVLVASPGVDGTWSDAATLIGQSAVFLTTGMVVGVAFGAVLLASGPAIVALVALPITWTALASLSFFAAAAPWLDTRLALAPLHKEVLTATQWAHAGTALALWMLLPLLIGIWRITRQEAAS